MIVDQPGQSPAHLASGPRVDDRWDDVLEHITSLCGRPREVEELPGGLTNVNLKVVCEGRTVVVRVGQKGSELLAIDRETERRNTVAAAEAGVGPPVIDFLEDPQLLVIGYVNGRTFTDDDLRRGDQLHRVAAACKQLHQGPEFVGEFNMFAIQRRYLEIVEERGFQLPDRYLDFAPQVQRIEQAMTILPVAPAPCNNDLLAGNFIDDGDKIWLIDYEYSGANDPYFELGNIWSEANLTVEHLEELLRAYDGAVHRHLVARARLWGLMSKYGWTLWASIQSSVSNIDFDFWSWGMEKYERAVAEFDDPSFEQLLRDVSTQP